VRSLTSFRLSPFRSRRQASVYALGRHRRRKRKREKEGGKGKERDRVGGRENGDGGGRRERVVSGHRKRAVPCVCWPVRERTPRCTDLSSSLCRVTACVSLSLSLYLSLSLPLPPSLSLSLSVIHSLTHSLSRSLSVSRSLSLSLSLSLSACCSLSFSLPLEFLSVLPCHFFISDSLATLVAGLSDSRRERRRSLARWSRSRSSRERSRSFVRARSPISALMSLPHSRIVLALEDTYVLACCDVVTCAGSAEK